MKLYLPHLHHLAVAIFTGSVLLLTACSNPKEKAIDQYCLGLEYIENKEARNNQYMQCRKACQAAEFYKMPEGDQKSELTQKCNAAKKVGDMQFQHSSGRNWLGVTP